MSTLSQAEQLEQEFCDAIDQEGPVTIMGVTFDRSYILKEMDPIAYDEGLANYMDSQGFDPDEDDGQPDEAQEWESFDPDC